MGEEDRKKYAMAQANQRAAGGAYMTGPPIGQVYEMSDAELKKAGWKESVESFNSYHDCPTNERGESYHSTSGEVSPEALSPSDFTPDTGTLTVPQASASGNGSRNGRNNGRSPLARASLIRTASEGVDIELQEQYSQLRTPASSPPRPDQPSGRKSS
jgi:chitin synthase